MRGVSRFHFGRLRPSGLTSMHLGWHDDNAARKSRSEMQRAAMEELQQHVHMLRRKRVQADQPRQEHGEALPARKRVVVLVQRGGGYTYTQDVTLLTKVIKVVLS